jgi:butyrate kinase
MTGIAAIDAGFSETRVGFLGDGDGGVVMHGLKAGDDPFLWLHSACPGDIRCVVIAGGSYAPCPPGVYVVDEHMAGDAAGIDGWHPRNRMTVRAFEYCSKVGIPCLALDPMLTDTVLPEARLSGYPGYERRGVYYAVPQRQAFYKAVSSLGLDAAGAPIITVYLGDETCVTAHRGDRVLDSSDPLACEGPFGLTSAGTIPATAFLAWLGREGKAGQDLLSLLKVRSGAFSYAGVETLQELARLTREGHAGALLAVSGLAHQVSKEIGRALATLKGEAECVSITGPGASLLSLTSAIEERVGKWCPVICFREDLAIPALLREGSRALAGGGARKYPREKRS